MEIEMTQNLSTFPQEDKSNSQIDSTIELKTKFLDTCQQYITSPKRQEGMSKLLKWLEKHDFFTAPASTRFHGAYRGGLVEHSLDVFEYALKMAPVCETEISPESIAVSALFHDLCKVDFYKPGFKNQKVDGTWIEVPCYTVEESMPFGGHGSKSVYIVSTFMTLLPEEAAAINSHMGFSDTSGTTALSICQAYKRYPLAWLVHVADEAASYIRKR